MRMRRLRRMRMRMRMRRMRMRTKRIRRMRRRRKDPHGGGSRGRCGRGGGAGGLAGCLAALRSAPGSCHCTRTRAHTQTDRPQTRRTRHVSVGRDASAHGACQATDWTSAVHGLTLARRRGSPLRARRSTAPLSLRR
eukprot:3582751-Rhodomonas_salina.1